MKEGDKVIFNGGSPQVPLIVKGVVFRVGSDLLVRDEYGAVYSTIGWKIETIKEKEESGYIGIKRKRGRNV